jgi:HEAT repeat protein
MAITMKDVRLWLDPDEPNYAGATSLGPAALALLLELVRGGDLGLASKATYLASLIASDKSVEVIEAAAKRNEPLLRVAAASGLQHLRPAHAERVLDILKSDPDPGVRKVMVKSASQVSSPRVAAILKQIARSDPEPFVRQITIGLLAAQKKTSLPRARKVAKPAARRKAKAGPARRPTKKRTAKKK